jgi:hypothetical protein
VGTFDAAAYGNPVVTTGFGGHLDYLAGSPYLVDFELVPVIHPYGLPTYSPDQRWAEPDVEHGASLLRRIAGDREGARSHAASLAQEIGWRYRPAAIAQQFRAAVEQRRARGDQAVAHRPSCCCLDRRRERARLSLALVGGPTKDQPLPTVVRCRQWRQDVAPLRACL